MAGGSYCPRVAARRTAIRGRASDPQGFCSALAEEAQFSKNKNRANPRHAFEFA